MLDKITLTEASIILTIAKCDMDKDKIMMSLDITPLSLDLKIKRIRKKTGLNPFNFYDLIELYQIAQKILREDYGI